MIPNILSIAGSDPSGGAGIQADIKAISANGGYAMAAVTALTAQNTRGVHGVHPVPSDFVVRQIRAILDDIRVDAVKIGMLGGAAVIEAVAGLLGEIDAPVVLDPVMVAKGGDRLLDAGAETALRECLVPRATLLTPNLPEAAVLLGQAEASDIDGMRAQAKGLLSLGTGAALVKGGHLGGADSTDILALNGRAITISGVRHPTDNTHGTGCTLSATLATHLGLGASVEDAAHAARDYIGRAIARADRLSVGGGRGPVHHFHDRG